MVDLRAELRAVLSSAYPNKRDHPCMSAAWERGKAVLATSPTVAELLPMVDATHRVRWLIDGNHREAWVDVRGRLGVSVLGADDRHAQFSDLTIDDLHRPGRLVEVGG